MKKIFTFLLICLFTALSSYGQKKIAYVSTSTPDAQGDTLVRQELAKTYTLVDIDASNTGILAACEAADIDMVLISEAPGSSSAGFPELSGVNKPVLNMKVYAYKSAALNFNATTIWGELDSTSIEISSGQEGHPIFTGIPTSPTLISEVDGSGKGIDYADFSQTNLTSGTFTELATVGSHVAAFELAAGSVINGNTIPQIFIGFGINQLSQPYLTTTGLSFIRNICDYLTGGTPTSISEQKGIDFSVITGKGTLSITSSVIGTIEVVDINGNTIMSQEGNNIEACLSSGIYIVRILTNGTASAKKVIVQ